MSDHIIVYQAFIYFFQNIMDFKGPVTLATESLVISVVLMENHLKFLWTLHYFTCLAHCFRVIIFSLLCQQYSLTVHENAKCHLSNII